MRRFFLATLAWMVLGATIVAQTPGPPVNALNLRVRADENNYLEVDGASTGTTDGPLVAFRNIRLRTDENGYLLVNCKTGCGGGGGSLPSSVQGDIYYASGTNTTTVLHKSATATRYIANTGTSNNPAWDQVDLTNGVKNALQAANFPALTGDVTNSAGSLATTIANNAITTAKINAAAVTEAKFGFTDITTANSSTSQHGLLLKLDNNANHFMNGTGAWATPAGASTIPGCVYVSKTANYTLVAGTDCAVELLTNAATFTLPTAVSNTQLFTLMNWQTAHNLTINTTGGQTVNGVASGSTVILNGSITVVSDNVNWRIWASAGPAMTDPNAANVLIVWDNTNKVPKGATSAALDPSTGTFTNITLDCVSGTGNHCTFDVFPVWTAGVDQNGTASLGTSFGATAPTAHPVAGTNTIFGTAQYTATSQAMQGMYNLPPDYVSSQTMTVYLAYFGETTSSGNVVFTFSTSCVAAGSTLDPSWTDTTITDAAGTANQLNIASQALTMPTCAANNVLFWKLTYTTAPTTPGNQDVIFIQLGMLRKPQ